MKRNFVKITGYKRKGKKVSDHKRRQRKLGKKIKYKAIGVFEVAHDNLGNIRGSRVRKLPKIKIKNLKFR